MSRAGGAAFVVAEPVAGWGRGKLRHAALLRQRAAELVGGAEPGNSGHWRLGERCSSSEAGRPGGVDLWSSNGSSNWTGDWSSDRSSNWSDEWTSNWSDPDQLASLSGCVDAAVSDLRFAKGPLRERAKEIDELLLQVVRGKGCLDLAIGGLLAQMLDGDHMLKVGYSTRRDYIRKVLDAPPRTVLEMAQVARELPERPLLNEAVRTGRVGWRKALLILDVAKGEEEAIWVSIAEEESHRSLKKMVKARGGVVEEEEKYVSKTLRLLPEQRAKVDEAERLCRLELGADAKRHQCVKAMAEEYMGAHGAPRREEQRAATADEAHNAKKEKNEEKESRRWVRVWEEHARKVWAADARRQASGRGGGPGEDRNSSAHSNGASVEPGCNRNPSAHSGGASTDPGEHRNPSAYSNGTTAAPEWDRNMSAPPNGASTDPGRHRNPSAYSNGTTAAPEWDRKMSAHSGGASADPGEHRNPSARPEGPTHHAGHLDPHAVTAQLQSLVRARKDWDNLLCPLAWAMKEHKLWRHLDTTYTSLTHYCTERLGICERTLRQHAWLEARLQTLPQLRQAYESRKLSFVKARSIAKVATPFNVDEKIADAKDRTTLSVEHEAEDEEDRNLSARGRMRLFGPEEMMTTVRMAMDRAQEVAREQNEGYITPGEALSRVAEHFVEVWKDLVEPPKGRRARILRRCEGICEVPECSRAAHHLHHIVYRSHGGKNQDSNFVALCPAHHLRGIHHGYMRVKGKAGARVVWEIAIQDARTKETYIAKLEDAPRRVEQQPASPRAVPKAAV